MKVLTKEESEIGIERGFVPVPIQIIYDSRVSRSARDVYFRILGRFGFGVWFRSTLFDLTRIVGVDLTKHTEYLLELESTHFIERIKNNRTGNRYRLLDGSYPQN